jgi:prepilin-type N-terminal cleavage/methylation domain-containing protein
MKILKAFSIIELMIVVAIIAFLATIAIPRYFNYFAKAKQAEVSINLASLHTAQESYKAEHGTYTSDLTKLNWKPQGNFQYTYGFNISGAKEGINYITGALKAPKESLGTCMADKHNFLAKAAGDITGKNKLDVWQIDENRELKQVENGLR